MPKVLPVLCAALVLAATPALAGDLSLVSYARLGQALVFDATPRREPGIGFGIRAELEHVAIDVSFLNLVIGFHPVDEVKDLTAGSIFKIEGLRYFTPRSTSSVYVGGGASWGLVSLGRDAPIGSGSTSWYGRGLQGEVTAGYELARHSPIRFFVQADASAPIFAAYSQTFTYSKPGQVVSTSYDSDWIPTVVVSVGVGWKRP